MHPSTTAQQHAPTMPAHSVHAPAPVQPVAESSGTIRGIERAVAWIGSPTSLIVHTFIFVGFFTVSFLKWVSWDLMFAVLTNVVSLEAIYLAIFIQMSVNRQAASLKVVEEDVGDIQEDIEELGENVEELGENVEDLKEDVEDIQEDIGEDEEDEVRDKKQDAMLEALTNDVKAMLKHLETLKGK
jgi:peptidoglycan hydrolase CwlO-like protein